VEAVMKSTLRRIVYATGSLVALVVAVGASWRP
jgi:hypothetical protein